MVQVPAVITVTAPVVEFTEQTAGVLVEKLTDPLPEPPVVEMVATVADPNVTLAMLLENVSASWFALLMLMEIESDFTR
jgi:hypothetical protein